MVVNGNERTHSSSQNLRDDFSRAAGGYGVDCGGGLCGFSGTAEHDRGHDYRRCEGNVCRALFHARSLQLATRVGNRRIRVVLDGNTVRADVQRLLDARLALSWLLKSSLAGLQRSFPHFDQALT